MHSMQQTNEIFILTNLKDFHTGKKSNLLKRQLIDTHGVKNLHTLLVKHYNGLPYGQRSERSIDKVTYFYVKDLFCLHLGTKYANF